MQDAKKVLRLRAQGRSQRFIAESMKISRNTVKSIFDKADELGLIWNQIEQMEEGDVNNLIFKKGDLNLDYKEPDFDYIHKELLKVGVTLQLLWEEYVHECRQSGSLYYQRSNFYRRYNEYVKKHRLTMHINHKPADRMMVDWDGKTMYVTDRYTGEQMKAYIFVATLPFSMYSFVQACPSMDSDHWIDCHVKAYNYFNGVTRLLVPDNLKTGITSHKKYEDPVLNKSYQEMADHYGTTIVPARVRMRKDKAAVESTVGNITRSILAHLRNREFFSFEELNRAILGELEKFNARSFQKKDGSRTSVFIEEEKPFLYKLPASDYEPSIWKIATVQINYHIVIDKMNYSVPSYYVGKKVDVKITKSHIEVFYQGTKICEHVRLSGRKNQYSTKMEHMPKNHQLYEWNGDRFKKWALSIGPSTHAVITQLLARYKAEEQAYKSCLAILNLDKQYGAIRLENASKLALEHLTKPNYTNIKKILKAGQDKTIEKSKEDYTYACVRGEAYYGKK